LHKNSLRSFLVLLKSEQMNYTQLITFFGTQTKAAAAIGLAPPSVYAWRETTIPFARQCEIEILTGGELKASRAHDSRRPPNAEHLLKRKRG